MKTRDVTQDMETKLPTAANLVYNLMLLITLAEYSPCLSAGHILTPKPHTCNL